MISFYFTPYLVPLLLTAVVSASLGVAAWQRRRVRGSRTFIFLMSCIAIHSFFYGLELSSSNVDTAKLVVRFEFIGISFLGLSCALHIFTYTGRIEKIPHNWIRAAFILPIITVIMVWSNDLHHLFWQDFTLDMSQGFTAWQSQFGIWFWVHAAYGYLLILGSAVVLFQAMIQSPAVYKRHLWVLAIAGGAPVLGNIMLFVAGLPIDPTPFMFAISGMAFGWALYRGRFLELVPIAREMVLLQLRDGVIVLDEDKRILDMNPAAEALLGNGVDEAVGQQLATLLPMLDVQLLTRESSQEIVLAGAGKPRVYVVDVMVLTQKHANGYVATFHDVTVQKETELVLRQARDEAETADRAKTAFLANMSHELRTPLSVILGYTELIQDWSASGASPLPTRISDKLGNIQEAGTHLLSLINNVLDFSKIEAGRASLELRPVQLNELIDGVIMMCGSLMSTNSNDLVVDVAQVGHVVTDEVKVKQILMNLLSNAAKFTTHGTVSFTMRQIGQSVRFVIGDTGIGMDEAQVEHLFEPFVQADVSTTRKYGGTGLGLAITQRFVMLLNGQIGVESTLGEGTTFTVMLPLVTPEEA